MHSVDALGLNTAMLKTSLGVGPNDQCRFGRQFNDTTATVRLPYRQFAFQIAIGDSARLPALFSAWLC